MKVLKTALIIIFVLIALGVLMYFLPLDEIAARIPLIKNLYNNTSITVSSRNGKAVVKINGKDYGETPVTASDIPEGSYTIEITRVSDAADYYKPKQIQLELVRNTEAIVDLEIGPSDLVSGYVLYYTKSPLKTASSGYITLSTNPDSANTYLDEEFFLKSPINAYELDAGNYNVKATKEGYEEVKFPIIIRNGYNLNVSVYLFPIPTTITKP